MKTSIVSFLLISSSFMCYSQKSPIKEYGIGFFGVNSFSLQYRWGDGSKFYRITGSLSATNESTETVVSNTFDSGSAYITTMSTTKSDNPIQTSLGAGFSILKLKSLNEKFGLMYGTNYQINFSYSTANGTTTTTQIIVPYNPPSSTTSSTLDPSKATLNTSSVSPSFGIVLGGFYKISDSFFLYGEIIPSVFYTYTSSNQTTTNGSNPPAKRDATTNRFGLNGISNSNAQISLIYRLVSASGQQ